ncbi:MAG: heavy-metal-associated domain-containing protein [Candidatus Bipolaricaulia bacterium]
MTTTLRSDDLSCPSCVANIESALTALDGVDDATVHFNTGRIEVQHDAERVSQETLRETIQSVGYDAQVSAF